MHLWKDGKLGILTSQEIHDRCDRRSLALVVMRAPKARDEHSPHLPVVKLTIQPPAHRSKNGVLVVHVADPVNKQHRSRRCVWSCGSRPPAAGEL
ncbi:hypothetical protein BDA96_10G210100 [Sorghum bicolor]|uniref:Uncharacterized protein n=2 Tax=Sorghum bicolor TaxID=4558 RepID=A0A921Q484_SORBI|nr:hypothetical protein BDA96_10G210100 [Sorghum bicolor]KXG20135.1 hypothetical protein SORBI_3010G160100 [Sorghum bicolor]